MSKQLIHGDFPNTRMRRSRAHEWSRRLVRENNVSADNLILPIFVHDENKSEPIPALPGVSCLSIKEAIQSAQKAHDLGIPAVALFPRVSPKLKDPDGNEALNPDNLICRAISAVKKSVPNIGIITDVALDPFTSHGHDGVVRKGQIHNDETVAILTKQALIQARAGANIIAPSDMMDGRVAAIRSTLDKEGLEEVMLMPYAAKYASAFYAPFRQAVKAGEEASKSGKDTYQMDSANSDEAMREIAMDISEGADFIIVKPGTPYLDIIRRAHESFAIPIVAYQVSGEYAMIEAAAAAGYIDRMRAIKELTIGFRRAGAHAIITYHAIDIAANL